MIACVIVQLVYNSTSNSSYYYYILPTQPRFPNTPEWPYDQMLSFLDIYGQWAYWSPLTLQQVFDDGHVRSLDQIKPEYPGPKRKDLQFVTEFDPAWEIERHARWKGTWGASRTVS